MQMTDRLQEGGVTLEIAAPAQLGHLIADRQRLKQILIKILTNAVNYAPEGSVVSMKCWREASDFAFSVSDNGCGMSADLVSSAFDRFSTSAKGGKRSGPGLGLSIVQSFVNLHKGEVKIDSEPGRGTTVHCRIPSASLPQMIAAAE
jgi:signal transduction histidine kinase